MKEQDGNIVVRFRYNELTHQALLRSGLRVEKTLNYGKGMESYFRDVMQPLVKKNESRIVLDTDGSHPSFDYEQIFNNRKMLTDFIGEGDKNKKGQRDFNVSFLRVVDAFLQLRKNGIDASYSAILAADDMGQMLGVFLKDQASLSNPGQQALNVQRALNVQNVIGIYEYDEVDTHFVESGERRVFVFLRGKSIDYLKVVDISFDCSKENLFEDIANYNFLTGICVPGREFSPVLTRSKSYGTRHLGLLYTRGNLVNMVGGPLDDLTYDSFTTNAAKLGSAAKANEAAHTKLFAQALDIHYGPRIRREMNPVANPLAKAKIIRIVESIAEGML